MNKKEVKNKGYFLFITLLFYHINDMAKIKLQISWWKMHRI